MSINFFYTISLLTLITKKSLGGHVLPEYHEWWFYSDAVDNGLDSCGVSSYSYINLSYDPDDYYILCTSEPGCSWNGEFIDITYDPSKIPPGFISQNANDWQQIALNPDSMVAAYHTFEVNCDTGKSYVCGSWVYPFYICPSDSRISYDNTTMEIGCTTTPTPCVADIVGRDLGSSGAEFFGHVGLVTTFGKANPDILEVLNGTNAEPSKIGIFLDPLYGDNSFVTQTKYWGSRYAPQNFMRLPLTLASQVIQAGIDQQQYLFNYTIGWFYYPGGTEEYPDSCEFRCDSFVYYCYEKGAKIKLQPYFEYPLTVPLSIFTYDFSCSADPVEYCFTYVVATERTLLPTNEIDRYKSKPVSNTMQQSTMRASLKIFQSLRPVLATKLAQRNQLPWLIAKHQEHQSLNVSELFMRCLCFELEKMNPSQLDQNIRPLLSSLLWQHKYLSNDNFLLALMDNTLSFYLENPRCNWLSAFFTAKAETQADKEASMIAYVDQQDNITEKANLVTASRFSSLPSLTTENQHMFAKLFRQAYNSNNQLSELAKKIIWLGLSEMKTPAKEVMPSTQFFQKTSYAINKNLRKVSHP